MAAFNNNMSVITGFDNALNLDDCPPGCVDVINAINTRVDNLTVRVNAMEGNAMEGNANANSTMSALSVGQLVGPQQHNSGVTNRTGSTAPLGWGHYNNSTLGGDNNNTLSGDNNTTLSGGRKIRKTKKQKKTKKRGNKGKKLTKRNRK